MCKGLISWRHSSPGFLETNCNRRYWVCLYFDCRLFFLIFFILVVKLITNGKFSWLLSLSYCFSPKKFRRLLLVWIGCLTFQRLKGGCGVFSCACFERTSSPNFKVIKLEGFDGVFFASRASSPVCQLSCRRCSNFISTLFERFHSSISMFFSNYS